MATRYALGTGYGYRWDGSQEPEIVVLPQEVEGAEGISGVYESTARTGWVDGVKVVWIDTPAGTFGQMEHMCHKTEI